MFFRLFFVFKIPPLSCTPLTQSFSSGIYIGTKHEHKKCTMQTSHAFAGAAAIANKHAGKAAVKSADFQAQSIAGLTRAMEKITARHAFLENGPTDNHSGKLPFNIPQIDACLGGGLARNALHEIRTDLSRDIAAASGFLLGLFASIIKHRDGQILWANGPAVRCDAGVSFPQGLANYGFDPRRLILVNSGNFKSALWSAGEAASCKGLVGVVLHVAGNPKSLDLTATRKLQLTAHRQGTTIFILRQAGAEEASAGLTRWRVQPAPSIDPNCNTHLGPTRLALSLERNRNGTTGDWCLAWNPHERAFENVEAASLNHAPDKTAKPAKSNSTPAHIVCLSYPPDNRSDLSPKMGRRLADEATT